MSGKFVASGTLKEADADAVVAEIVKLGVPSMVASDVSPAPSFVLKIAARFNVRCFEPGRVMHEKEKSEIAGETENLHERDALAAAVKCYREYANRLRQIELLETGLDKDMLKHLVIQGYPLRSAELMLERKTEPVERVKPETRGAPQRKVDELLAITAENVNLRKALEAERQRGRALEAEIEKMKGAKYAEIGKDAEVRRLRSQIKKMSWLIRRLKDKMARR